MRQLLLLPLLLLSLTPLALALPASATYVFQFQVPVKFNAATTAPVEAIEWSLDSGPLPVAVLGEPYSVNFHGLVNADADLGPLSWTAVDFPGWLSLSANGVATGTPTGPESAVELTVMASSGAHGTREQSYTLPVSQGWAAFAAARGLSYGAGWNNFDWGSKGLGALPSAPFPNSAPSGAIYLNNNDLTQVDGLASLTSAGSHLYLSNNNLTHVDGMASLVSVGSNLHLGSNNLTQVDGLSSLTSVGGVLYLPSNSLTNVDGLASLTSVGGNIRLQNNPGLRDLHGLKGLESLVGKLYLDPGIHLPGDDFVPIPQDAWLCLEGQEGKFAEGFATQAQACGR